MVHGPGSERPPRYHRHRPAGIIKISGTSPPRRPARTASELAGGEDQTRARSTDDADDAENLTELTPVAPWRAPGTRGHEHHKYSQEHSPSSLIIIHIISNICEIYFVYSLRSRNYFRFKVRNFKFICINFYYATC